MQNGRLRSLSKCAFRWSSNEFAGRQCNLIRGLKALADTRTSYLNVLFPGATDPSRATWLSVGPSEEKESVDFALQLVRSGSLQGEVRFSNGEPARGSRIVAYSSPENLSLGSGDFSRHAVTSPDGHFAFGGIQPGSYTIVASGTNGSSPLVVAQAVHVSGVPGGSLSLVLGDAATVAGQITFEPGLRGQPDFSAVRVRLRGLDEPVWDAVTESVQPDLAGAFTFRNVVPGRYFVESVLQGPPTRVSAWRLKAIAFGERSLLDEPVLVAAGQQLQNVKVTFTDVASELSGRMLNAAGAATYDRFVVLFPTNPSLWHVGSVHMRAPTRPATDGTFGFTRLPAGAYYLAVISDFDPDSWRDKSFLNQLIPSALPIELKEGEKRTQDLRLR
jgi:hypothetical protein